MRMTMSMRLRAVTVTLIFAAILSVGVAVRAQLAPGPVPRAEATFEPLSLPAPAELVQAVLDFPVGGGAAPHVHGGAGYVTMIAGEITLQGPDGVRVYRAGDSFVEQPGYVYAAVNTGGTPASLMVTYMVPKGAPVTTVVGK